MSLNDCRLCCLTQDLEQIIITDKVKSRKARPFLFKEFIQTFLTTLEPIEHGDEGALDGADPEEGDDPVVALRVRHDHPEVVIDLPEDFAVIETLRFIQD